MGVRTYSILRSEQYKKLQTVAFTGTLLDLGGSNKSGYHELLAGQTIIITGNIDPHYGCDMIFDVQEPFPFQDSSIDSVVSLNLFEHVYQFGNAFAETARVLKPGGTFVISTPFMFQIHGSPDDFYRYTKSFYKRILEENGFHVERIEELGFGLFSLVYQLCGARIRHAPLRNAVRHTCVFVDRRLLAFKGYRRLRDRIPLGYFVVARKD
jgi:SAM-dependent methyltransferase